MRSGPKPERLRLDYTGSAATAAEYPAWAIAEVAVAGRSNCGKSSLLNCLGGRSDLARVSKTPGRTQRIHFFRETALDFALVDLPGYGFARVSKADRARFAAAVDEYLRERRNLRGLVLLLDVRRTPEAEEHMLAEFTASRGIRLLLVATKVDKLGRAERARRFRELDSAGLGRWVGFSSISREGRDEVLRGVAALASGQMENAGEV